MKRYICLGPHVDKEKGCVTGLAMMHELFISLLRDNGYKVDAISLNSDGDKIALPGLKRFLEYIPIFWKLFCSFAFHRKCVFYFNPATTKSGLYRDAVAVKMAKFLGHKVVMQQFGALFNTFMESLTPKEQQLLDNIYNKADLLIVEGNNAREQYPFIQDQNIIKVVQNGLPELKKNIQKMPKHFRQEEPFNMFFMNNMIESKGYMDVLNAVDILVNKRKKNVTCVFAGRFMQLQEDVYFKDVEEAQNWFDSFIKEKDLISRVKYYKSVFDDDKAREFISAHVFLLPSYYIFEGQPTSILEALSYGCVPIVTRFRLIPDMVNEDCGVFVNPKSPQEIADVVERLIETPMEYERLSKNAYERFNEHFTQEAYTERILNVIKPL